MPKPWNDEERIQVKNRLIKEARLLFEEYGLQKTTIDEIIKVARISKGAFYIFYGSKEELYFAVLEQSENEFRQDFFREIMSKGINEKENLRDFLASIFNLLVEHPLYRQLTVKDYEYLMKKVPAETLQKHILHDFSDFGNLFGQWMEKGLMRKMDMKGLNGIMISIFYFVMHRNDFPDIDFAAARDLWVDMLVTYMFPGNNENREKYE